MVGKEDEVRAELKAKSEGSGQGSFEKMETDIPYDLDQELMTRLKTKRPYLSIVAERLMQAVDDHTCA